MTPSGYPLDQPRGTSALSSGPGCSGLQGICDLYRTKDFSLLAVLELGGSLSARRGQVSLSTHTSEIVARCDPILRNKYNSWVFLGQAHSFVSAAG